MQALKVLSVKMDLAESCFTTHELSQDGGRAKFTENLLDSPFNKDGSIETTFSQIHSNRQYL